jgi:nucleoside-diphosphate-sugar epimerase
MPPSVLVVGAAGYIGDGVARAFRRAGYLTYGVIRDEKQREHLVRNEIIPVIG